MKALSVVAAKASPEELVGSVLCHNIRRREGSGFAFRKGHILRAEDLETVRSLGDTELHLLRLEEGDLHEEEAGRRLAEAVAGPGIRIKGYIGAQYHLVAAHRGLLRVDVDALRQVNSLEGVSVFTALDYQPVEEGSLVAGVKVTPLVVPHETLREAERASAHRSPVQVLPFRPARVGALVLEKIDAGARERFQAALERKLRWFGSQLVAVREVDNEVSAFSRELQQMVSEGTDIIMTAGASSLDPLEPLFLSLREVGAQIEKHGVPVHPGSLFWLARLSGVPVFGLSSCEMFSHRTVLDIVLCRLLAGVPVSRADLIELGHGGLLEQSGTARFPNYGGD